MSYRTMGGFPWPKVWLLVVLLVFVSAAPADVARLALVVGNAAYQGANPLINTRNDARDMAVKLQGLGFRVISLEDATREQFNAAVKNFIKQLQGSDAMGLFYYSGHGLQVNGTNYLLPVDAQIEEEWDVPDQAVAMQRLLEGMAMGRERAVNLLILDACRDNPFAAKGKKSLGNKGIAVVESSKGTLVLYAAQPGATASDNPGGRNGLFTGELLKVLDEPGVLVEEAFKRVAQRVYEVSGSQKQLPWQEGVIFGQVYLVPPVTPSTQAPGGGMDDDHMAWQSADKCGTLQCYEAYVESYPEGRFVKMAKANLASLQKTNPIPPLPTQAPAEVHSSKMVIEKEMPGEPEMRQAEPTTDSLGPLAFEPQMVPVKGGSFLMGSPATERDRDGDERLHQVKVANFEIGKYEVSQAQWRRVMGTNPSYNKGCDNCPVEQVSWNDIQDFLGKLNARTGKTYRLPTEAEWEYACRAGGKVALYCGGANLDALAWYDGNSEHKSHPVGQKTPNGLELYDMSGNVWEWTCSIYDQSYRGNETKCAHQGEGGERVLRGSSWGDNPRTHRAANRDRNNPELRDDYSGFRLVRMP